MWKCCSPAEEPCPEARLYKVRPHSILSPLYTDLLIPKCPVLSGAAEVSPPVPETKKPERAFSTALHYEDEFKQASLPQTALM